EQLSCPSMACQCFGGLEPFAQRSVTLDALEDFPCPLGVAPAEQAAAEGREAGPEDHPHIDVARLAHDVLFEDAGGFEQHRQEQPVGDLVWTGGPFSASILGQELEE